MAARVFTAFPARPLRGRPPGGPGAVLLAVMLTTIFGGMLGVFLWLAVPTLATDWLVRDRVLLLRDGMVTESTCKGQELFEVCGMTLSAPVGTGVVERKVGYVFGSRQPGFFEPRVVANPAFPEQMTTDLGMDRFWDRVASLVLLVASLGGLVAWSVRRAWVAVRRVAGWRGADALPVALRLVGTRRMRGGQMWTVQGDEGGPEHWTVPGGAQPFALAGAGQVLGLQRLDGSGVMPLDSRLRWVSLSRAERARVLGPQASGKGKAG